MLDEIFTKRLKCRKITAKDIELITLWSNSSIAYGDCLTPEKASLEDNQVKLKNNNFWNDNSKTYLIEIKENSQSIGTIKYWAKTENIKTAMIALKIAIPQFRKKGYGTEVQKALIRDLFKKYKFETIEMYTDLNNVPQQKCLEKLDFKSIKTEDYTDSGTSRQGFLFRLTKEQYEKSGVHLYYYD